MAISPGVIPLTLLCAALVIGAVAGIILTHKITRVRRLLEAQRAAEIQLELERVENQKPVLVDVYVGQPKKSWDTLPWMDLAPISTRFNPALSCPHPHHTIEHKPGYEAYPLVDGNVLQVSVGISMPRPRCDGELDMAVPVESLEYCIGTSETAVCTLLNARPRLLGLN